MVVRSVRGEHTAPRHTTTATSAITRIKGSSSGSIDLLLLAPRVVLFSLSAAQLAGSHCVYISGGHTASPASEAQLRKQESVAGQSE